MVSADSVEGDTVRAAWMVARSELRRRWRSTALITLTVVVVGGIVLGAAAGARRSMTALSRLQSQTRASTLELDVGDPTTEQLAAFEHAPGVAAVAHLVVYVQQIDGYPNLQIAAARDERLGTVVDRALLISGRVANPRGPTRSRSARDSRSSRTCASETTCTRSR